MTLRRSLFSFLLLSVLYSHAQQSHVSQRIFLVSDAGVLQNGKQPVCDWLKQHVDWNDPTNTIIYLGNNIYPAGLPAEGSKNYNTAKEILDYQLSLVQGKNAKAFFIPGNHEWKNGKAGGLAQVQNESQYINKLLLSNVQALPGNGCPGPVEVQLGDKVVLVFMDSQWWLQQGEKTGLESDCDFKTDDEVITALKDIIGSYPDKLILLAMHHPVYSHGKDGGYFTVKLRYKDMISQVEDVLKLHPNVIHASGHDHSLQFLQQDSVSYIVSGAGSATTKVEKGKNSLFAKSENGFGMVEVSTSGEINVKFYTLESRDLLQPVYTASLNSLPAVKPDIAEVVKSFPDSVTVIASDKFKTSGFKNFLLGKNYREEWKTPVRVKVINIGTEYGGLTPLKRGGGHQTMSLRLETANGKQYVLRLIEKSITQAALPPELRGAALAKDLVSDGVSASYPYSALSVPVFAEAAKVPHTNPRLVYVPDDPRLGKFRIDFANSFCLLEERIPGNANKVYSTDEMADKLKDDNDNELDQRALLRARLLDMFFMDFDRHEDQWIWSAVDNGKGKTFQALPRDRDQAFFVSKGVFPSVARWPWVAPQVQGFRSKAININTYNFNGKNIDRAFLNELDEADWKKMTDEFLPKMTDELIETALHQQPKEIQSLPRNQEIIQKLKDRRKYYAGEIMQYYRFISKIVSVTGSDKKELFDITRNNDGSVLVQVFKITKEGEKSRKMYERKFDPAVTKEIRLYAMGGDDKFVTHGEGNSIKVRMIGGSGNDVFESGASTAAGKNIAYDLVNEQNQFTGNNNIRKKLSDDPDVNKYERLYYKYNLNIPFVSVSYNPDDGLFLGASIKMIRHGFRKTPYKTMHQFAVNHALATNGYNFKWYSEFIGALGKKSDLLLDADIKAPSTTTNFFGYGNATVYDKTNSEKYRHYRARYQIGDISMLIRKKLTSRISMIFGPTYQFYSLDSNDNKTRYILKTGSNGVDPNTVFKDQSYAGGRLLFNIDLRNNKVMPSRGINWTTSLKVLRGLNDDSKNLTQLGSDLSLFLSFSQRANFVIATRFGAAKNFGEGFEFYQAQYLGSSENLRGYRKYRFAGQSMAFNNTEIRFKIAEFRTYLFPGSLGLFFFHDVGRVWAKNDFAVSKWHTGYGGGIWFAPMSKLVITAAYTTSKEASLPLITFGWQF
ncbi:MAG: BamA/TamA family outer membrane protein [Chitinophagaceae bacterium]